MVEPASRDAGLPEVPKPSRTTRAKTLANENRWIFWIIGALAAIGTFTFGAIRFYKDPPQSEKYVWFIFDQGSNGGAGQPGDDLLQGVNEARRALPFPPGVYAHLEDDKGNGPLALSLAQRAIHENAVAVVGHLESSIMAETIGLYAQNGVPVIMPVPTNPNLTSPQYKNVIRMPPNDTQQAKTASDFMFSRLDVKRVAVFRDAANPVYSDYLATKFTADMRELFLSRRSGPVVVYDATIGAGRTGGILPDVFKSLQVNAIFFAGSTENAITFLEMLNISDSFPLILMTDGVVERNFLRKLSHIPKNLYVSFQMGKATNNGHYCNESLAEFELSFCPYGVDSVYLVQRLLQKILDNTDARLRTISRENILDNIAILKKEHPTLRGDYNNYKFDENGDNTAIEYSIWKAETNRFSYFDWHNSQAGQ